MWAILDVILEGSRETIIRKPFAELDDADEEGSPGKLVGDLAQVLLLLLGGLVSVRRHKACSVSGGGDNLFVADRLDTTTGHVLEVLLVVNTRLNCGSMKPVLPSLANLVVTGFACLVRTPLHSIRGPWWARCALEPKLTGLQTRPGVRLRGGLQRLGEKRVSGDSERPNYPNGSDSEGGSTFKGR